MRLYTIIRHSSKMLIHRCFTFLYFYCQLAIKYIRYLYRHLVLRYDRVSTLPRNPSPYGTYTTRRPMYADMRLYVYKLGKFKFKKCINDKHYTAL